MAPTAHRDEQSRKRATWLCSEINRLTDDERRYLEGYVAVLAPDALEAALLATWRQYERTGLAPRPL